MSGDEGRDAFLADLASARNGSAIAAIRLLEDHEGENSTREAVRLGFLGGIKRAEVGNIAELDAVLYMRNSDMCCEYPELVSWGDRSQDSWIRTCVMTALTMWLASPRTDETLQVLINSINQYYLNYLDGDSIEKFNLVKEIATTRGLSFFPPSDDEPAEALIG